MQWIMDMFQTKKPIIAMCHFQALPGDPGYDLSGGIKNVVDKARKDLLALQGGGVDAVMFSNEFSLPYLTKVPAVTIATMAYIIGELKKEICVPFGVNALWDPIASIDLAAATDALFIREIITGVYASDFGLWNTNVGETVRHCHHVHRPDIRMLYNIVPEAACYLGDRDIGDIARSTVFNNHPDILCVSGLTAGTESNTQILGTVKNAVPDTPVFCNTGCRIENVERQLGIADGAVVGTTFKFEGKFKNAVDKKRVKEFMDKVKEFRKSF
jgi:membrane complex biogenesis BtpA family protein